MMKQQSWIDRNDETIALINERGQIEFQPQLDVDRMYFPSYGLTQVKREGRFGYVNQFGNLVIPFRFAKAYPFSENGLAFVVEEKGGKGGYINREGEYVIPPRFDTGTPFKFGLAAVSNGGVYYYITPDGYPAINEKFLYASEFADCGLAKVVDPSGRHVFMDNYSRIVLAMKKGNILLHFKEGGRAAVFNSKGRHVLIDAAGNIITRSYDNIRLYPYSHFHPFLLDGLWGYLNDRGEEVIPNIYEEVNPFNHLGYAKVKAFNPLAPNGQSEFYIDQHDQIITPQKVERKLRRLTKQYQHINAFQKGRALVRYTEEQ